MLTHRAGPKDTGEKFAAMFRRRLEKGQCFSQPYLGCREFAASFEPAAPPYAADSGLKGVRPLGLMLFDVKHTVRGRTCATGWTPRFFDARLVDGVLVVPRFEEVMS